MSFLHLNVEYGCSVIDLPEVHGGGYNATFNVVLSELVRQGWIQRFECTHELAWNVIKDYAAYQHLKHSGRTNCS